MSHAIIRGANGRRHEVDFDDVQIRVEVYSGEETVEIVIEAIDDTVPGNAPGAVSRVRQRRRRWVGRIVDG